MNKNKDPKRGKQDDMLLAHQEPKGPLTYPAARLEGKVKNMGIKNLGKQKRKGNKS